MQNNGNNENKSAIEVKNLKKSFGSKIAVSNLSFSVPEGTITGFIGPNGAGKTTTIRMLATLMQQDSGDIRVFGQNVRINKKSVRHKLGFMPDSFGLYEDMEVEEYLDFFAAAYHIPMYKRKTLVEDLLQLLDLKVKQKALVNELSRGMQQRLSLGRALVHDPKLLLLDEPASGLDPRARIELMGLLRELRNMGKTIFVSSHILAELKELCDFVVIIERGKMIYNGTVEDAAASISGGTVRLKIFMEKDESILEKAQNELSQVDGVSDLSILDNHIALKYDVAKTDSSVLVKFLVSKDFNVHEVLKETVNLEEVFMTLTEGGVS